MLYCYNVSLDYNKISWKIHHLKDFLQKVLAIIYFAAFAGIILPEQ